MKNNWKNNILYAMLGTIMYAVTYAENILVKVKSITESSKPIHEIYLNVEPVLKSNSEIFVFLITLLFTGTVLYYKRKKYIKKVKALENLAETNNAEIISKNSQQAEQELISLGREAFVLSQSVWNANKKIKSWEAEHCVKLLSMDKYEQEEEFKKNISENCKLYIERIDNVYMTIVDAFSNSIKQKCDTCLDAIWGENFDCKVVIKTVSSAANIDDEKELEFFQGNANQETCHMADSTLYIKHVIVDSSHRTEAGSYFGDKSPHRLIYGDSALMKSFRSNKKCWVTNDTKSLGQSYTSGPDELEKGYNAKLIVPVYKRENMHRLYAYIVILLKNNQVHPIFYEDDTKRDPIINFVKDYAVNLARLNDDIHLSKKRVITDCGNNRIDALKGFNKIDDRRKMGAQ